MKAVRALLALAIIGSLSIAAFAPTLVGCILAIAAGAVAACALIATSPAS